MTNNNRVSKNQIAIKIGPNIKQAKYMLQRGYANFELFTTAGDLQKNKLAKTKEIVEKILSHPDYGNKNIKCISVHAPTNIMELRQKPPIIKNATAIAKHIEAIQSHPVQGVVIHEMGKNPNISFKQSKRISLNLLTECDSEIKLLFEPTAKSVWEGLSGHLSLPDLLDEFIQYLKGQNFGLTFDLDHVYETLFYYGLNYVGKPVQDYAVFKEYKALKQIQPKFHITFREREAYLQSEYKTFEPPLTHFNKQIDKFLSHYKSVLGKKGINQIEKFRADPADAENTQNLISNFCGDTGWKKQEGFHPKDEMGTFTNEIISLTFYPSILKNIHEKFKKHIGLYHLTGTELRVAWIIHERRGSDVIWPRSKNAVKLYNKSVYREGVHYKPGKASTFIDLLGMIGEIPKDNFMVCETKNFAERVHITEFLSLLNKGQYSAHVNKY